MPEKQDTPTQITRKPSLRSRLLTAFSLLLGVVLVFEVIVRIFFPEDVDLKTLRLGSGVHSIAGVVESSDAPLLRFELKRGIQQEWQGVFLATDDIAPIRISTLDPPISDPVIRIALLGDSTAFGRGVAYECTYGERLRASLARDFGVKVEVRNFACPGYNTEQERILFDREVLPWKPHMLLQHYDHQDPDLKPGLGEEHLLPEYGNNVLRSALYKFAKRRSRRAEIQGRIDDFEAETEAVREDDLIYYGTLWDRHLKDLDHIATKAREQQIIPIALVFCHNVSPEENAETKEHYDRIHVQLEDRLRRAGFGVIDVFPRFRAQMVQESWENLNPIQLGPHDPLPNRIGHRLLAEILLEHIKADPTAVALLKGKAGDNASARESDTPAGDMYREAVNLAESGEMEKAVEQFRSLIERKPKAIMPRARLLELLLISNDLQGAGAQFAAMTNINANIGLPYRTMGSFSLKQGKLPSAITFLRLAIDRDTNHYSRIGSQIALAEVLQMTGQTEEAIAVLTQ